MLQNVTVHLTNTAISHKIYTHIHTHWKVLPRHDWKLLCHRKNVAHSYALRPCRSSWEFWSISRRVQKCRCLSFRAPACERRGKNKGSSNGKSKIRKKKILCPMTQRLWSAHFVVFVYWSFICWVAASWKAVGNTCISRLLATVSYSAFGNPILQN